MMFSVRVRSLLRLEGREGMIGMVYASGRCEFAAPVFVEIPDSPRLDGTVVSLDF
jgi:hypothetical protein